MNELQIFSNEKLGELEVIAVDGKAYFAATESALMLNYSNPHDAILKHCRKDGVVKREVIDSLGRTQQKNFISEGNLLRLITHSKMPGAEEVESWIFDEVIPSIRKHGGYINGEKNLTDDELLAKAFVVAQSKIAEREKRIASLEVTNSALTVENEIMRPKSEYFDELVDRNLLTTFRDTAKQLGVQEKSFIRFLLDTKYVYRDKKGRLQPYAQHVKGGLFKLKEGFNEKTAWRGTQTLITPKGRETFRLLCIPVETESPKKDKKGA